VIDAVAVTRYVLPLREGGSLPGVVEGDDLGTYVCKFRGAGQGVRVLVAEVVVAGLARRLGLRTPRLVRLELDPEIARYEADEEVQDLLKASTGPNLGIDFLPGAFGYDGTHPPAPGEAAAVLWLDAFTANVDRSWRNPNLLVWHGDLWLIDHGAALYFHHSWRKRADAPLKPYPNPGDHVLLPLAGPVDAAGEVLAATLDADAVRTAVAAVPDEWLDDEPGFDTPDEVRDAYVEVLTRRLDARALWTPALEAARASL
jgi:hypothetical protein